VAFPLASPYPGSRKSAILSRTAWTFGTIIFPSTTIDDPFGARGAVWWYRPLLGEIDLFPAEHRFDSSLEAGFLGQLKEKIQSFVMMRFFE
jgi:hypothetical protein